MKTVSLPDYDEFALALEKAQLKLHSAQLHGLACGVLCGKMEEPRWDELLNFHESAEAGVSETVNLTGSSTFPQNGVQNPITNEKLKLPPKTITLLHHLYEISKTQLGEFAFKFELMLPKDLYPLNVRAEALTLWCQGFLTGLNRVRPIHEREAGDAKEAINDLVEIAKMDYEEVVESEEDEKAYVELVEFVRIAVILIYQDEKDKEGKENKNLEHLH